MGAALSIAILFTVYSTIVRVAAVFLEHTGIPRDIARIQSMSALSGTGFTTSESEMLLRTPERRRILAVLMVTGSIGLALVVATLVVGVFGVSTVMHQALPQIAAIFAAIIFLRYVLFAEWFDRFICKFAFQWLKSHGHIAKWLSRPDPA